MSSHRDLIKRELLEVFEKNVKGKIPDLSQFNKKHDGREGDWLTIQMGLKVNGKNEPDYKGFEMKTDSPKTTFGDWSPTTAIYKKPEKGTKPKLERDNFLTIFGHKHPDTEGRKAGRYSWCTPIFPNSQEFNNQGQIIKVDNSSNVIAYYYYSKDKRLNKAKLVPVELQVDELILAKWDAKNLKSKLEKKFNKLGWFKCIKDKSGKYEKIQFGNPINFENFIKLVKTGDIFCDSGMYSQNSRPYMNWRASKNIWTSLAE